METDLQLRVMCFAALARLRTVHGDDVPYVGGLDQGFMFDGERIPFMSTQKGIFRAQRQRGPAALGLMTSFKRPYTDEETDDGFWYAYRSGSIDQADNRALRAAAERQVPLAYYVGVRPGCYQVIAPTYVVEDDAHSRRVRLVPGNVDVLGEPVLPDDVIDRRYSVRQVAVRLHQRRFRGIVVPAYRDRCAICRLKEQSLLDAAHIIRDIDPDGEAAVTNGLSLCSIHHRAFDNDLVGVSPDYQVHIAARLLDEEDGPMLELLKGFHGHPIDVPSSVRRQPDRDRLAARFEQFNSAA